LQSGVAINPWAFQPNPLAEATKIAERLGVWWSSTQDLINQLRNVPFQRFVDAQSGWGDLPVPRGYTPFEFVPNVEPVNSPEPRFLTDTPTNLMNRGQILTLPMIVGYMSVESLFIVRENLLDDTVFDQFAANPHFYVPLSFNLHPTNNAAQVNEVATQFRSMYFQGGHPTFETRFNYSVFMSENHFTFGIDRAIRYHVRRQTQPIYYYKFDFDGSLNMIKRLLLLTAFPGAVHADVSNIMFSIVVVGKKKCFLF
jgi:bile salt-stimulated lipase